MHPEPLVFATRPANHKLIDHAQRPMQGGRTEAPIIVDPTANNRLKPLHEVSYSCLLYTSRIPANDCLMWDIAELLTRSVGLPAYKPVVWYKGFLYRAASWTTARRVVAKVEFHAGELFPRVGFIVTNTQFRNRKVIHFYNQRGKAEQWIKEGKQAVKMTRLSCHRFRSNEVCLLYTSGRKAGRFAAVLASPASSRALQVDCADTYPSSFGLRGSDSVSYTHLDVYKRQSLDNRP